jgi:O-antigen/teichoic acid export membrane protein
VALEKFVVLAIIEVSASILKLLAVIGLAIYTGNQLRFFSVMSAAIAVASVAAFVSYCRRTENASVRWRFQRDVAAYKEMLGFSSWILIGAISNIGRIQGAALIINAFFGMTINAAFALANSLNQIVLMVSQNLGQAAIPQITKNYSSGNKGRSMDIVSHISKYSFFLMLLPAIPILLETKYLLRLWLGEVPQYTEIFCKLVVVNSLAGCLGAGIPAMVAATGKIKWFQIVLSGTSLLSLPIAYACFKRGYPAYAILVVQIVIVLVNAIVRQVMLKKIIAFDVKSFLVTSYLRIAYVLLFVGPVFLIKEFFQEGFGRFLALSCGGVLWTILAIHMVGTTKREKEIAVNGVLNLTKRFRSVFAINASH